MNIHEISQHQRIGIRDFISPVVVYHHPCHDGITALAIARHYYGDVEPIEGRYDKTDKPPLEVFKDRDVLFVDFCYDDMEYMTAVAASARAFAIVDHHISAKNKLKTAAFPTQLLHFDLNQSGAGLLWKLLRDDPAPPLIASVEDRDLWRFQLPNTREIHAACDAYPLTIEARERLLERKIADLVSEGEIILRYQDKLVRGIAARATTRSIAGYEVPYIELPVLELISEVGNILAKDQLFAALGLRTPEGRIAVSLRSAPDGLNVAKIAERFGGGGHPHAAGYLE